MVTHTNGIVTCLSTSHGNFRHVRFIREVFTQKCLNGQNAVCAPITESVLRQAAIAHTMVDPDWAGYSEQEELGSGSIRNELEGVLKELSSCKGERKGSKLMTHVRRRFMLITNSLLMLFPIWLLFGSSMYFVGPKRERVENLQAAINAYEVANEMLLLGEALTQEWIQSRWHFVQPTDRNQTLSVFLRSDEVIKGLQYLEYCLAYNGFPVSNGAEMLKYLHIFRQDGKKTLSQIVAFYGELVFQPFKCTTDLLRELDVQENWINHVGYQHLISAILQLSQLSGRLPVNCEHDEFDADEALRLADTFLSNIYLARYFKGEKTWWTHEDSLLFHLSDNDSNVQFCREIQNYSSQIIRKTHDVAVLQTKNTLAELGNKHMKHQMELAVFIAVAVLCFLAGTLPLPFCMVRFSNDIQMLTKVLRELAARTVDEKDRSNSVLCKLVPARYAPFIGQQSASVGTHSYECVSVLSLSIPSLQKLTNACTPGLLINILTSILKLVEQRISLYDVHIIQKASFTYTVAAGMNVHSRARHVTDIANMALDLLNSCSDLEIEIVPDSRVQLQIGICTGPCIGTIPDQRPIRYCLVGRTVQMAAKLEKTSQLNAIHLSETTAELLEAHGFYRLAKTGHVITQNGYTCESYWLMGRRVSSLEQSDKRGSTFSTQSVKEHIDMVINPLYRYDSEENIYVPRSPQITCYINRGTRGPTARAIGPTARPLRHLNHRKRASMPDVSISLPAGYRGRLTAADDAAAVGAAAGRVSHVNHAYRKVVPSTSGSSNNSDRNSQS